MVSSEPLKMGCDCSRNLFRLLYFKEMTNDLSIMGCLSRQALHRVPLRENLYVGHDLDYLGRLRKL